MGRKKLSVDYPLERFCKWCGAVFSDPGETYPRDYCSEACLKEAQSWARWSGEPFFCVLCGKAFKAEGKKDKFCSPSCKQRAAIQMKKALHGLDQGLYAPKKTRKCHDCGRSCVDYRCPSCQKKFKKKWSHDAES